MKVDHIFIEQALTIDHEIEVLLSHFNVSPKTVTHSRQVFDYVNSGSDPISRAKKTLYITTNKGAVVKECPGTSVYTCCDYTILHTGTFCSMDCSYCILQAYFHPPVLQYFAGLKKYSQSLDNIFSQNKIYRIGTGEYTDSLIWEPVSLIPSFLVSQFAQQDHCVLELKTKTVNIDSLLDLEHNRKTILAWSLNTPDIIQSQEKGTASLKARLKAAQKAANHGYPLAFHFDPLVIYPDCEKDYKSVIDMIFEYVTPQDIVWISLGTFRYMPALKQVIEQRFPDSTICYGEFILGLDNKMRYFKPLRIHLYQTLIQYFRTFSHELTLYFCMEDKEVWQKCMGFFPEKEGELGHLLDKSAKKHCHLGNDLVS